MERRAFFSAVTAGLFAAPAFADDAVSDDTMMKKQTPEPQRRKSGKGWLRDNPKFQALSMDGKRQIEYAQPLLKKLPKPGPGMMYQYMFGYDSLSAREREELVRLVSYIEYMREDELRRYLGVTGERSTRQHLEPRLRALSKETRIPYHSGSKVVVVSFGPWENRRLQTRPPHPHVLPHAAKDLLPAGTYYTNVTDAPGALQYYTHRVFNGGYAVQAQHPSISERLHDADIARLDVWGVAGPGTHASPLGRGDGAPYLITTDDGHEVDAYLQRYKIGEKLRQAKTPEQKRALRKEVEGIAIQALDDLDLRGRFSDREALDFVRQVMFRERGIKDRGNTFVHVAGLRAMQLVHPKFLYVQFGGPDETLRKNRQGRTFGEQGAVGQGDYPDADYLSDLDQWSYYHWLEAQDHPHYKGETTFVLLFGPQPQGATQAIVTGPGAAAGKRVQKATPLTHVLGDAVSVLV